MIRLSIPNFATFVVAMLLRVFALVYLVKSGRLHIQVPNWITNYGYWIIPSICILRATGDFKYVDFSKNKEYCIRKSSFKMDDPFLFNNRNIWNTHTAYEYITVGSNLSKI